MIAKKLFGRLPDGRDVYEYTLSGKSGMTAKILDFGGALRALLVPNSRGNFVDTVQGFDALDEYRQAGGYLGALVGRVCNRTKKGKFSLEGKAYTLFCNDGENSLHGGKEGFSHKLWHAEGQDGDEPELHLFYASPDGEEGYPGTLSVEVIYKLLESNALSIHYLAKTDRTTLCNLTNHSYFNVGGVASGKVDSHLLWVDADRYLPVGKGLIPTGEIASVAGTPLDFRSAKPIGRDLDLDDPFFAFSGGYDHYVFFTESSEKLPLRATLRDPASGRTMKVYTDQPGMQIYSANFLCDPAYPLKGGLEQAKRIALCMETAKPIDAINNPNFGSTILSPGEVYDFTTVYAFSNE